MERNEEIIKSDCVILLSTLKFIYNFAIIPSGGARTKCREIEAVMEKSVVKVVNEDN